MFDKIKHTTALLKKLVKLSNNDIDKVLAVSTWCEKAKIIRAGKGGKRRRFPKGRCCVYAYIDPRDGVPFYIGATRNLQKRKNYHVEACTSNRRCYFLHKKLRKMRRENVEVFPVPLFENLSKNAAFNFYECFFIKAIGRRDLKTGSLCNLTGGSEGNKELGPSTRRKMSKAKKGKPFSKRHKRKLSEARRKRKPHSIATCRKIAKSMKGNTNVKGKRFNVLTRRKMSKSARAAWLVRKQQEELL